MSPLAKNALVLGLLSAIGPFAIDMYLPAFPAIAADLQVDPGRVQLTLVAFFVALAAGQGVYGPISDNVGRKGPLYVGLGIFVLGSVGCAFAQSVEQLIAFRFVQGLGASGGMAVTRAVVRDLHTGPDAARLISLIMLVLSVSPVLAPMAGSTLAAFVTWKAIFVFIAATGLAGIATVALALPETLPRSLRKPVPFTRSLRGYGTLLRSPRFMALVMIGGFTQGTAFAYLSGSSFLFIDLHQLSPAAYSVVFAVNAIGLIGASQATAPLMRRFGAERLVLFAMAISASGAMAFAVAALLGQDSLPVTVAAMFVLFAAMGLVMGPAAVMALDPFPALAGTASALMGILQFASGAVAGAVVSVAFNGTALPMAGVMAVCNVSAFGLAWLACRHR